MMLSTQNESWGFWGTMGGHACVAWPVAICNQPLGGTFFLYILLGHGSFYRSTTAATHNHFFAESCFENF
mgnify:CR=1 FL=1